MKHLANVSENGKLELVSADLFRADIAQMKGKEVELTIKVKRNSRSLAQNAFYWGVLIQLANREMLELGNEITERQVHSFFKSKFLQVEETIKNPITGQIETANRVQSTTELDTKEFEKYIFDCAKFCAEFLDLEIPIPNNYK